MNAQEMWQRYKKYLCTSPEIGLRLDVSRMLFSDTFLSNMEPAMLRALAAMADLERGAKANIDEDRMVGHYWLRAPALAPTDAIRRDIDSAVAVVKRFATDVHSQKTVPERSDAFYVVLVVGIGGSVLGGQFVCDALSRRDDTMMVRFIDNTDPDGIDRVLDELDESLDQTLTVVISKSGDTQETRNGMLEVAAAYRRAGLHFHRHAVAITKEKSALHERAIGEQWLATFPMWDWVGGRTSGLSAVGLLPAALQGVDIDALLNGARDCDVVTRKAGLAHNPAALLATMWHYAAGERNRRNMVVLPYRDRLLFFSRYLQQLVMESVGKKTNRRGDTAHTGITVYGNKGSTDQHSLVQQLREGPNDFFTTFIGVLGDRAEKSIPVEEDVTAGDCLHAFLYGTRDALFAEGRESITLTVEKLNEQAIGGLIALFERTVGLYAELVDVNAYHQPGVEAGKHAAAATLDLQRRVLSHLRAHRNEPQTVEEIALALGRNDSKEAVLHILDHAAANPDHGVRRIIQADAHDSGFVVG